MKKALLAGTAITAAALYAQSAQAQIVVSLGGYTEFFGAYYRRRRYQPHRPRVRARNRNRRARRWQGRQRPALRRQGRVAEQHAAASGRRASAPTKPRSTWAAPGAVSSSAISMVPPIRSRSTPRWSASSRSMAMPTTSWAYSAFGNAHYLRRPPNGRRGHRPLNSDDATKISYITPRFAGFQAGASYAPQSNSEAQDVVAFKTVGGYKDFWEFGPELYGRASWLLGCCGRNCRRRYRSGSGLS